jgi:hypothetical protein
MAASAILKTWPAFMPPKKVLQVFSHEWGRFYFTLGRGKPQRPIDQLWYTHRGRILGYFCIGEIVQNVGQLPKLRAIDGTESEWQIRGDAWVAICPPPFLRLREKLYHEGFRGWRYFDLDAYRGTTASKVRI